MHSILRHPGRESHVAAVVWRGVIAAALAGTVSCNRASSEAASDAAAVPRPDNTELAGMYAADQADRENAKTIADFDAMSVRDSVRRARTHTLLAGLREPTANDLYHAAMIFQHGDDTTAYRLAYDLSKRAAEIDTGHTKARWLSAASWDRYLMNQQKPQWYGTQFSRSGHDGPWILYPVDTTRVTDAERIRMGVGTLTQQRAKADELNKTSR